MQVRGITKRLAPAVIAAAGAAVLAGCGTAESGQLIGARPIGATSAATPGSADPAAAIQAQLDADLAQADATSSIRGGGGHIGGDLFPSDQTLMQIERIDALQKLGDAEVAKRLSSISVLRASVVSNHTLSADQEAILTGMLDSASSGLRALQAQFDAEKLVDQCRNEVRGINLNFHVEGLLLPRVHLLVAAYDMQSAAATYQKELDRLTQIYNDAVANNQPTGSAGQDLADLASRISSIQAASSQALSVLPGLTAAAYPGNRPTLDAVHSSIVSARQDVTQASVDIDNARTALP